MKSIKLFVLIISLFCTNQVIGQSGLNFQGVARNENGVILASQEMSLRLSIVQGSATGSVEFSEVRKTTTNAQGLFSVVIGGSNAVSTLGNFNAIDWKLAPKFLKIEMDVTGGENFTVIGTTQLQSAAYAKFAESADATNLNGVVPISKGGTGTTTGVTKAMIGLENVDNTSDLSKPISTSTQSALDLKASLIQLNSKEDASNKSTNVLTDAASDTKFPSVKSVKTYVDNAIQSGVPDATTALKGKIILAGALTGTADLPEIATNAIGTNQLLDASVSDAKIIAISGTKVIGNIDGNASNITGVVSIANGGTGANNANDARANLGLTIGTNVESPLTVASPLTRVSNTIGMSVASSGVNGYLSSTDWTNFNSKINASEKAANNGVATLGANGKIPSDQIPAISFQSANVVASQSAMLALNSAVEGSIAIRTDNNKNYVLSTTPASTLSNWIELATPSAVTSVNGAAGPNVVLTTDNIAEGSTNKYYSNTQVRNAIGVTAPLTYDASTGGIALPRASMNQAGYLDYTDWIAFDSKMGTASATATFVPYTGATGPVNLGAYDLTVNGITAGRGAGGFVSNTALGVEALMTNTTGLYNTALGNGALKVNTTGYDNISLGSGTLYYNTTGFYNTASGGLALHYNVGGNYNTATGGRALIQNFSGNNNTAVGYSALLNNLNSSNNTALGFGADITADGITNATSLGYMAKVNGSNTIQLGNGNITDVKTAGKLTTGVVTYPNTHGTSGQILSTTGAGTLTWTTLTGVSSQTITSTSLNNPFDFQVLTGYNGSNLDIRTAENLGNGSGSLASNTNGIANTAFGIRTLKSNTTGAANTAFGFESLFNNSTGQNNTGLGTYALRSNTTGSYNTAVGSTALLSNTIGVNNASFGEWALLNNISGSKNTAHGANTIMKNTTGNSNTGIGFNALFNSIDGNRNTAVGEGALYTLTNGSYNTALGYAADVAFNNLSNATAIGYYAQATASNSIQLGNGDITDVKTAGKLTSGAVTYPNLHGSNGQVLSTTGSGTLTWTTPTSTDLSNITGVLSIAKGGTGTSTQNFVDLNTNQTITGFKTFSADGSFNGVKIGRGGASVETNTAIGKNALNAHSAGGSNTAIGNEALYSNINNEGNTAIGSLSLSSNTYGMHNTAVGMESLNSNTTGYYNQAFGYRALFSNTTASNNTAMGTVALSRNTTGEYNIGIGRNALIANTVGNKNVAIGVNSMDANIDGTENVGIGFWTNVASGSLNNAIAIGSRAIVNASNTIQLGNTDITDVKSSGKLTTGAVTYPNTDGVSGQILSTTGAGTITWTTLTGISSQTITTTSLAEPFDISTITGYRGSSIDIRTAENLANGTGSLSSNTDGIANIAVGIRTLKSNTIGSANTALGFESLYNNTVGYVNTAVGAYSLRSNTTGAANTAIGSTALLSNTTGVGNVGLGEWTLMSNTTASGNTAIGTNSMFQSTTGAINTAVGFNSLFSNKTGNVNTGIGTDALYGNTTGSNNTAIGRASLPNNTTGSYNTALGNSTLFRNTTGINNLSIGYNALNANIEGSNNIGIGYGANLSSSNLNNAIAIGANSMVTSSNTIQLGNTDITDVKTVGKLTTGAVTYPNTDGVSGQVLTTTGAGTITWTTPTSTDLSNITGVLSIAKGGTGTSTQNFVDVSSSQNIAGNKTFSSGTVSLGLSSRGSASSSIAFPHVDDPAFISHYSSGNQAKMSFSAGDDPTNDYFVFGYGLPGSFVQKVTISADGKIVAPLDASINGLTIGKGNNSSLIGNTIIGNTALANNTVGEYNTALGNSTLRLNTSGAANTAVGNEALQSNTSGALNIAVGASALQANTSGSENTAVGTSAMYLNTTGAKNTALGYYALRSNTIGAENTATGDMALYSNTEGSYNTANGSWALYANNVGRYNTSVGHNSTTYNTSGNKNTSVGAFSLYKSTNASNNTSVGANSLSNNNTGSGNTSMGVDALYNNTIGEQNIAYGNSALGSNISGGNNTALGHSALYNNQTGSNNTAIGAGANVQSIDLTNATAIGYGAIAANSNTVQIGNANITNVKTAGSLTAGNVTYPNTHGTSGQILTTTGSGTLTWTAAVTHYVGEVYGGGIVFYVYDNGQHGLIASTSDQATDMRWYAYNGGYVISMAYANGIGAGSKNTNMIISRLGIGDASVYAARACNEYNVTLNGVTYGDWYLPSKHELNLLRNAKEAVGNFSSAFYWSSTENDANTVWGQNFDATTTQSTMDKGTSTSNHVRAIRSF